MTTPEAITTPEKKIVRRPPKPRSSDPLLDLGLLTMDEACEALRVSRWTLSKMRLTGEVPIILVSGKKFVRRIDLDAVVDAAAEEAQAALRKGTTTAGAAVSGRPLR